jgi:hypothetical protein
MTHILSPWLRERVSGKGSSASFPPRGSPRGPGPGLRRTSLTVPIAFLDDRHRIEEKRKRTYETFKSIMKKSPFNGKIGRSLGRGRGAGRPQDWGLRTDLALALQDLLIRGLHPGALLSLPEVQLPSPSQVRISFCPTGTTGSNLFRLKL